MCLPNLVPYDADILFDTQNGMEGTLLRDRLILAGSNMEAAFLNLEAMLAAVIAAGLAMLLLLYIATPFTLAVSYAVSTSILKRFYNIVNGLKPHNLVI